MSDVDKYRDLRKKFRTVKEFICGWAVILSSTTKNKKGREKKVVYFISHVKDAKLFKSKVLLLSVSGPVYISRYWKDEPRVNILKVDPGDKDIRVDLEGLDLGNIVLSEYLHDDLRDYLENRLNEVIDSEAGTEDEDSEEVF